MPSLHVAQRNNRDAEKTNRWAQPTDNCFGSEAEKAGQKRSVEMYYNTVTLTGYLTKVPALRYTQKKKPVCEIDMLFVQSPRKINKKFYIRVYVWDQYAVNLATNATAGTNITVTGALVQEKWRVVASKKYTIKINSTFVGILPQREPPPVIDNEIVKELDPPKNADRDASALKGK